MLSLKEKLRLVGFAVGIFTCYTIFGIVHERIFRQGYENSDGSTEKFELATVYVAVQSISFAILSKIAIIVRKQPDDKVPQNYYLIAGFFCAAASTTASYALKYISYPAQVIVKAAKPIPVMILGVLIGRKSYSPQKYFFVLMIVVGVGVFSYSDKESSKGTVFGHCLIAFSLLCDGLLGGVEDRMRSIAKPTTLNFIFNINKYVSVILIAVLAVDGEGRALIEFAIRHPIVLLHISGVILIASFGQVFVAAMLTEFGPLPLSLVTTTRKFFTAFISVIIFGNNLSLRQWICTGVIFAALLMDSYFGKAPKASDNEAIEAESLNKTIDEEKAVNENGKIMNQEEIPLKITTETEIRQEDIPITILTKEETTVNGKLEVKK